MASNFCWNHGVLGGCGAKVGPRWKEQVVGVGAQPSTSYSPEERPFVQRARQMCRMPI